MAEKKTELEEIQAYGIDTKNRRVYFGTGPEEDDPAGGFHWGSVEQTVRNIHKLVSDSATKPIELHMNSGGGNALDMLRLYDEIQACPCKVIFVGGGEISSSATWIMAGCDERLLYPNTYIVVHDGYDGAEDRHTDFLINAKATEELQDKLYRLYESNSRMPYEFWADVCQRDLIISAEEAILLGLADKIVEPKKRGNLRRARIAALKKDIDDKAMKDLVRSVYKRIRRRRTPTKIEIHFPKEKFDKNVYVDETTADLADSTERLADQPCEAVDQSSTSDDSEQ